MPNAAIDYASLLCSRLCHDLLGPVGAINNGVELLTDENDPEMRQRYVELLSESARASADKLKFFRLAFGAAGGFGDQVATLELRAAIEGLAGSDGKVALGWMVDGPALPKSAAKVLLNLALIALDALVRGGRLDIGAESGEIVLRAEGQRLVLDPEIKAALIGQVPEKDLTARTAAAWLVHRLVQSGDGTVQVADEEAGILVLGATLAA